MTRVGKVPQRRCAVESCERPWRAREWCYMHYQRLQRHGDVEHQRTRNICSVVGCDAFCVSRGWCSKHLTRWKRHGSPTARMRGEVVDGKRICSICKVDKPLDAFTAGDSRCKPCFVAYTRTPAQRAQRAAWGMANADKMRQLKRIRAHQRRVCETPEGALRITPQQVAARMQFWGNRCWMCHGPFEHIDHVKPISKGGPHMLANLRPACQACNQSKSAHWEGVAGAVALAA